MTIISYSKLTFNFHIEGKFSSFRIIAIVRYAIQIKLMTYSTVTCIHNNSINAF